MSDDHYEGDFRVLSSTTPVARKPHTCSFAAQDHDGNWSCGIKPGDRYRKVVMLDPDEGFQIFRDCLTPCVKRRAVAAAPEPAPVFGPDEEPF